MTAGFLMPREIYETSSGLNPAMENRVAIAQPFACSVFYTEGLAAALASSIPLTIPRFSYTGSRPATSFEINDFYYRVQIVPGQINAGNVAGNETFTVGVWNAWLATAQTLDSITDVSVDGITLTGPPAPPLVYRPNQFLAYTCTVSPLGPPQIDVAITFSWADAESPILTVTGSRVTAWTLTPDWQTSVRERIGFLTDVMIAWSGAEQRRRLRIAPRRVFTFSTMGMGQEKRYIENACFAWGAQIWAFPIWPDGQRTPAQMNPGDVVVLADTVNRDFVAGGFAIVIVNAATFELVQIATLTATQLNLSREVVNTWPAGTRLYPTRNARMLSRPEVKRESQEMLTMSPEFTIVEPCDWTPATGLPQYLSLPVLEDSPDLSIQGQGTYPRLANITDNTTGSIDVDDTALIGFPTNTHQWYLNGRSSRAAFRSLLYFLAGRWQEIWVPSYDMDVLLVTTLTAGALGMTVEFGGFEQYAAVQNRRDIRIELTSGTVYYRRITGANAGSVPNTEILSINAALGVNVTPAQIRRISFMALSRLSADEIEIEHVSMADGIATANTPFTALNDLVTP
jgi:hypothetical protein